MDITNKWFNYLLTERKLSREIIEIARLDDVNGMLKIPVYDEHGVYKFSKFRKPPWDKSDAPKYMYERGASVSLYGIDHLTSNVIICEGELDVLACITCGFNACTSTGGSMSFQEEWVPLFDGKNVTLMFDNDEPGIKGAVKTALMIRNFTYRFVPPGWGKDISDILINYDVEKGKEVLTAIYNAHKFSIPTFKNKSEIRRYCEELRQLGRRYTNGSPLYFFIQELILQLSLQANKKRVKRPEPTIVGTDVERARNYPIENIIKVRRGKAICPFHDEKTPSFHVYSDNHAYCFGGCGRHYDAIDVAMKVHGVSFKDAVKMLQ